MVFDVAFPPQQPGIRLQAIDVAIRVREEHGARRAMSANGRNTDSRSHLSFGVERPIRTPRIEIKRIDAPGAASYEYAWPGD
jgi:hypothetical protein